MLPWLILVGDLIGLAINYKWIFSVVFEQNSRKFDLRGEVPPHSTYPNTNTKKAKEITELDSPSLLLVLACFCYTFLCSHQNPTPSVFHCGLETKDSDNPLHLQQNQIGIAKASSSLDLRSCCVPSLSSVQTNTVGLLSPYSANWSNRSSFIKHTYILSVLFL